jgi:hypothetical protein
MAMEIKHNRFGNIIKETISSGTLKHREDIFHASAACLTKYKNHSSSRMNHNISSLFKRSKYQLGDEA